MGEYLCDIPLLSNGGRSACTGMTTNIAEGDVQVLRNGAAELNNALPNIIVLIYLFLN